VLRRLVAVSFFNMLLHVIGFWLGFSFFRSPHAAFETRNSCQAAPEGLRQQGTWPKALRWLLPGFALLIVATSASATELRIGGGSIEIEFVRSASAAWESVAREWVERSARAISDYYGRFPVARLRLRIASSAGSRARDGTAYGFRGPLITIALGRDATTASLADDWLLTHEMVHLAFPSLPERHHWLEEGLATYVEPIAQARAGLLTPERVWSDLVVGLPQGQPQSGDRGLDNTPTWGRTYWGGALFYLRADLLIRQRTGNRYGLEHALRAILAAGGSIDRDWSVDQVLNVADQAVGVPVLRELYEEMASQPVTVDLGTIWQQLGIRRQGNTVTFDDRAPLASIRNAITPRVPRAR
jgi:hypothetical protein